MIICHTKEDREKCTKRLVETVATNVKYHSSQNKTNQSTAQNAFRNIEATDEIKKNYNLMILQ